MGRGRASGPLAMDLHADLEFDGNIEFTVGVDGDDAGRAQRRAPRHADRAPTSRGT